MQPYYEQDGITIYHGDCLATLATLPDRSAQTCVTSPPYFGLRDYGVDGQIGLEQTPGQFVAKLVEVFRKVRRVLRDNGTLWLNLGDSYAACAKNRTPEQATANSTLNGSKQTQGGVLRQQNKVTGGLKPKDLIGIPWMVAFALRADGWYLRQDIIWHKPNPMPESVRDRCTKAHEYLFLLSKSDRYFIDEDAMQEPAVSDWDPENAKAPDGWDTGSGSHGSFHRNGREKGSSGNKARRATRNRRSVWTVATRPYKGAHFATFPPDLIEPCILAGSRPGDVVLDPFNGSGTTGAVAQKHGRRYVGCELNESYIALSIERFRQGVLFGGGAA